MSEKQKERKRGVIPEDFYKIKKIESPRISPDGKKTAYVLLEVNKEENAYNRSIWVVENESKEKKKFTAGGNPGDSDPRWSPDSKRIAFCSGRAGKQQIFLIDIDGGEARPLTSMPNGASFPVWSTDGKRIAFLSRLNEVERKLEDLKESERKNSDSDRSGNGDITKYEKKKRKIDREAEEDYGVDPRHVRRILFRTGTVYRDGRRSHIYIKEIDSDQPAERLTDGDRDYEPPAWSPDGEWLLSSTVITGDEDVDVRRDIVRIHRRSKRMEPLTSGPDGDFSPRVVPGGDTVLFLSFHHDRLYEQRISIKKMPFEGGEPEDISDHSDLDVQNLVLSFDGRHAFFIASHQGNQVLFRLEIEKGVVEPFISGARFITEFSIADESKDFAFAVSAPHFPSDLFTADYDGKHEERITEINRDFIEQRRLSIPEEMRYRSHDGLMVQGWIMKPHDEKTDSRFPLVVEIHGGPHIMWGNEFWHEFQSIVTRGYAVFFCNPRGSEGYGRKFKGAIHLKWGDDDAKDILAGVELAVEKGIADPDRLFITGGSFGGFMTSWIIGHDHRFKAAVAQRGVYDLISLYGNSDAFTLVDWEFDTEPWEKYDFLWKRSPLAHVKNVNTPLLIIHSENDFRAGIHTADELFVALKKLKKEVEYVRYPREGHELSRSGEPEHRVDRIRRIIDWFEMHDVD